MPYDPILADRVRDTVAEHAVPRGLTVQERTMFGGLAFMVAGKMACGVVGQEVMARIGPDRHGWALDQPHTRPMDFTGRPMTGYIFLTPAGAGDDQVLHQWIALAVEYVAHHTGRAR